MKIALVAPLHERVPPDGYGAVETIVGWLANGLAGRGHDVTLFAAGGSRTNARLHACGRASACSSPDISEPEPIRYLQLDQVRARQGEFDIVHSHIHSNGGTLPVPFFSELRAPVLHTLHSRFTRESIALLRQFRSETFVAISAAQRRSVPWLNVVRVIQHGIPLKDFDVSTGAAPRPYAAFLGRLSASKAPHLAIRAARAAGVPLRLAGRIKPVDRVYFEQHVLPELDGAGVQFIGEVDDQHKKQFLAGAAVTLFSTVDMEPFGLVMLESMACGTPVVAFDRGAAREIVEQRTSGALVETVGGMAAAIPEVRRLSRCDVRRSVAKRFSIERMVQSYEAVYAEIARSRRMVRLNSRIRGSSASYSKQSR